MLRIHGMGLFTSLHHFRDLGFVHIRPSSHEHGHHRHVPFEGCYEEGRLGVLIRGAHGEVGIRALRQQHSHDRHVPVARGGVQRGGVFRESRALVWIRAGCEEKCHDLNIPVHRSPRVGAAIPITRYRPEVRTDIRI